MEILMNVRLLKISANGAKKVIIVLEINGKIKKFDVRLFVSDEIFGVGFPADLGIALRDFPQATQNLIRRIDDFRQNKILDLPEILLTKQKVPELQPA
jgi:hypothetical protein